MKLQFDSGQSVVALQPLPRGPVVARSLPSPRIWTAGSETILLVEHQESIRNHMASCLEKLGYKVLVSSGPAAALALARRHRGDIDLLLTDFSMPGMSGPELSRLAAADHPGMKVLYMSGYPEELVWEAEFQKQKPSWLAKPFTSQLLGAGVRKALGFTRRFVLVVDEDHRVRGFLSEALRGNGYEVLEANGLDHAREILNESRIDLVIGDLARFEQQGEESVRSLRRLYPGTRFVLMTGSFPALSQSPAFVRRRSWPRLETDDLKARWLRGADATLPKPVSKDLLIETVGRFFVQ